MERLVHYIFGLVFAAGGLLALPGDGQANEGFGERVAGTYFVEHSSGAFRVITLNSDGGLSAIASSQGGSVFEGVEFTSQQGTWKQNGARALIATVINFGLGTDTTGGTVVATYELSFGRGFDTVEGVITLLNFAPGVNPFDDDAKPIDDPVESTVEGSRVEPGTLRPSDPPS
jgi:hypothetical protein